MDKNKFPSGVKKILLIQLGDIGDVVWMIPTIRAVKRSVPDSKIYLLVRESIGNLLDGDPSVERTLKIKKIQGSVLDRMLGELRFFRELRSIRLDMAIDMRAGDRGAFMAALSGAGHRIALYYEKGVPFWRNYLFTRTVRPAPTTEPRSAAEQTLKIVRELGIEAEDTRPKLHLSGAIISRAKDILRQMGLESDRLITLNPFSRWEYKEWSDEYWAEIIEWLEGTFGARVAIIGSPDEKKKAEKLVQTCRCRVHNLVGRTTLGELAGVLRLSRLHAGVDSAAPHIAAAVGTPTVTIYGPSRWDEWNPVGEEHRVVHPDRECAPCFQKGCEGRGRSLCLEELKPDKVKRVISESLKKIL